MSDSPSKKRQEFRNVDFQQLSNYRLPFPGKVSILHRISGVILFLSLPILISVFAYSVSSPFAWNTLGSGVTGFILKLMILVMLWGFMHHLCAGIRFLLLDAHYGIDKESAQKSAKVVLVVSLVLTLVFGIKLFGAL